MAKQVLGKVMMIFKGTYDSATAYEILDVVTYEGSTYVAKKETTGSVPTDENFWAILVKRPIKGLDYFTDEEKEEFVASITDDANSVFNQNVADKTTTFNENAANKTTDFDTNVANKTTSFDVHVTEQTTNFDNHVADKTTEFDTNATNKTTTFNDNVTQKTTDFNTNAIEQTTIFNANATSKTSDFDTNASNQTTAFNDNATAKTEAYNTNAQNQLNAYNTNAEELLNYAENMDNIVPKATASGELVQVDDALDYKLLEVRAKPKEVSKQETTTGKNICPSNIELWESGQYNEVGTKTDIVSRIRLIDLLEISLGQSYYFNLFSDNYKFIIRCFDENKNFLSNRGAVNNDINITFSETVRFIGISIYNSIKELDTFSSYQSLFENGNIKPLICLSSEESKNFEEYTGGQASPNPDYPQEIETNKEGTLHVCGKNHYDENYTNQLVTSAGSIETNSLWNMSDYINVKSNTNYTLSHHDSNSTRQSLMIAEFDKNKVFIKRNVQGDLTTITPYTITTTDKTKYVLINYNNTYNNDLFQLEAGDIATFYEKYKGHQSASIDLQRNEIVKLADNVEDELVIDAKGNIGLIKNTKKINLDTNVTWILDDNDISIKSFYTSTFQSVIKPYSKCLSNYLLEGTASEIFNGEKIGIYVNQSSAIRIKIGSEFQNVEQLKQWLSDHDLFVYCQLAIPEIISLGNLSQLIKTFEGINNIWIESNLGATITVKYAQDLKVKHDKEVSDLQFQIDEIKTLLSSTATSAMLLDNLESDLAEEV